MRGLLGICISRKAMFKQAGRFFFFDCRNTLKNERGYKQLFAGVYLTILLVTIRNIFRWAEFLQSTLLTWPPPESTFVLAKNQPLFYSLDTLPILLAFLAFIIFHPSRLLPRTKPHSPEDPKTIQVWELQSSKSRGGTSESF